jgi:ubiquinone/menaquinone biosynthesis C-methylase UbiE
MSGPGLPSRRLATFYAFVRSHLGVPPARVLEVGCGQGELALALAQAGYSLTAVDPRAPEGAIFRRCRLEDFFDDVAFDAVVASLSLHHVDDLPTALDRIVSLLRPRGLLVLEEFAKERLAGPTARWYYDQRRALAAAASDEEPFPDDFQSWLRHWTQEHADVHPFAEVRRHIEARFTGRYLGWQPYLFDYRLDDALEPLERELIEAGAIEATGVRYVGERRG